MGPVQSLLKSVGSSLWLQWKLDRSMGLNAGRVLHWVPAGSGSPPLLLSLYHVVTIRAGTSQGTGRQMLLSDLLFLVLGGCLFLRMKSFTIIGLGFGFWGFLVWVWFFFFNIFVCTVQCLSGSSFRWKLVCYFRIFLIHNPGAGLKKTLLKTGIKY